MELKKSPKADLQNKRALFFEIGLTISLLAVIGMFAWSQTEKKVEKIDLGYAIGEEQIIEITRPEEKQPPKPVQQQVRVISDVINVVTNDTKIDVEMDFTEFDEEAVVVPTVERAEETVVDDAPHIIVEEMPKFMGGDITTFRNWVQGKINYPSVAAENGIQGRVTVRFVVERDGTLTNIEVLQSPDRSLSEEAIRVLKTSPKWTPGKQRNMAARVQYNLPVIFQLN